MNAQSIPVAAMAGISLYVGFYHLLIYSRRRQHREDLTFALLCLATCLYNVFCIGLYNSATVAEGVQWQRAQLIALALFTTAFLWFAADYMHQRPGPVVYAFTAFYLLAIFIQLVDRSSLTWVIDQPSIKEIVLFSDFKIVYYEAVFGPFTTVQSLMGLVASTYILVNGIRFYQRGYKREARPLLVAMGLMYAVALNDTAVANGLYQFVYAIEYGYMAIILLMAYSLSNTIVEAAMSKEALRISEERFRALVETTSDWVWEVDRSGVYTYASPKVVELLGYEPQDIIGKTPFDLMPPAEARRIKVIFQEMMNGLKPIERLENTVRRKDGQNVMLETSGVPFFDLRGKLLGYRGIDRDITERRRAEEALRESEEKFRSIFEQSSDSIVLCNEEGRIVAWNHAAEQMTGLTRAEAAGQYYWDIQFRLLPEAQATPAAYERLRSMMEEALQTGQAQWLNQLLEGEMHGPAGQRLYFQQVASPIRTSTGFMISNITRDITEHRRSDEALRASEALYQSLVEILPMSVCRKDLAGRFTFVNQRYCNEFRRPASDILGKTDFDLHPADLAEKYRQDDRAVMTSGQTVEMIEEHAPLHGERTYVQVFKSPLYDARGQVTGIQIAFWDVTERKKVEETLQMFQYTIDRSSDAVQWLNREGGFEYVNDQACRALGYTREELMSLRLWDVDPIYPRERWEANWESYQPDRRGGNEIVETLHRRKDGSVFPVEVLSNHLWFGDRELHVAVVRDITERKQTEQLLQLRLKLMEFAATHSLEELLQKALDEVGELTNSPIGFYHFVEADQRTLSLQAWSTRTLAEYCEAEGKGLHYPIDQAGVWADCVRERRPVIHNDYASLPHRKGLPEGHASLARELVVPILRGDRIVAILGVGNKAQAYTDKDVEIVSYAADLAWEVTERKQAEEALRESEEKYRRLVEVSPVAMWINQDGTITYMNPAALRILGATDLQQVVGRATLDFVHPDYHAIVTARISQMVDREEIAPLLEEKYIRLDGSVVDVEVTATPFTTVNGQAMQVLFQDITERKRAEVERERLIAELENKNAELERFTYTASHDLKSPLVTIRGFLGFLEKDALAGDLDQLRADIARVRNAADRMQRLLNELLELSRIGRLMNEPETVPFAAIVQEAIQQVQGRIAESGVQVEIQPDLPVVHGDRTRLVEVVQNLVDNACKFMGDQAEPRVTIGRRGSDREGRPILFVRDNGSGIDPEFQERIFGLFNKLDPRSEGTGIGLALVQRIVEVHGGRIWVESAGAKTGSTFYFTLPVE